MKGRTALEALIDGETLYGVKPNGSSIHVRVLNGVLQSCDGRGDFTFATRNLVRVNEFLNIDFHTEDYQLSFSEAIREMAVGNWVVSEHLVGYRIGIRGDEVLCVLINGKCIDRRGFKITNAMISGKWQVWK